MDFKLNQPFAGFPQRLLCLTSAYSARTRVPQTVRYNLLGKKPALAGAATAVRAFVAGRLQQRLEDLRRLERDSARFHATPPTGQSSRRSPGPKPRGRVACGDAVQAA